jgi:GT2 family glycosyltransferase
LQSPRLSVVVVNYRYWDDTAALVGQLLTAPCAGRGEAEVVIVDNHSPPHPLARSLRRRPGVSLRRWGRNRGFARAANEGCRLSRGRWLLLLNPDMTAPPGFLDEVLAVADRLPNNAGVVGFGLRHGDGSDQLSAGPFPTLAGTLARLVLPRRRRKYQRLDPGRASEVDWVTGCCLLVRRDCFEQVGGFDPGFFLYYEDMDLCRRARARGWTVWYEPGLCLVHHRPLHTRDVSPPLRLFTRHALLTYAARHWPRWQLRVLAGVVQAEGWLRAAWARWRGNRDAAAVFGELRALAGDLARGRPRAARRRLGRVVRREEERLACEPVGRDPQPQPPRPARRLPAECAAARPARHPGPGGG